MGFWFNALQAPSILAAISRLICEVGALMRGVRLALVALLWVSVLSPVARGAEPPAVSADALYGQATRDLNEGRYPAALEKFRQGLALAGADPQQRWRSLLGVGLATEKMGQGDHAIEAYRAFLSSYSGRPAARETPWAKRAKAVEELVGQLEAELLESRGALVVTSRPEGARIEVDGRALGLEGNATTPFTAFLAPGAHDVRLLHDEYRPALARAAIERGARRTVDLLLEPLGKTGRVTVRTGSPDALVFVDRARVGEGVEVIRELDAGPHTVRVACPGRTADERSIRVEAGQTLVLSFEGGPSEALPFEVRPVEAPAVEDPVVAAPVVAVPPRADVSVPARRGAPRPLWGWIGVGTGGALLATGAVFTVLAKLKHDDLVALDRELADDPDLLYDRAKYDRYNDLKSTVSRNQVVAGVMYGVGGAAVVGSAVYLIFFADHGGSAGSPVSLTIDPRGSLAATFRW
jgi:hypothetical protein